MRPRTTVTAVGLAIAMSAITGCSHTHTTSPSPTNPSVANPSVANPSVAAPSATPQPTTLTATASRAVTSRPAASRPAAATVSSSSGQDVDLSESGPQEPPPARLGSSAGDQQAVAAAQALAVRSLRLYLRRDVSAEQWIADLSSWLSSYAQDAYRGTRPYKIPRATLTGAAPRMTSDSNTRLVKMAVATTKGVFTVVMSRSGEDERTWRVERFELPAGLGG